MCAVCVCVCVGGGGGVRACVCMWGVCIPTCKYEYINDASCLVV